MKKIFSLLIILTLAIISLFGCNTASNHFTGEWKFASISKIELKADLDDDVLDLLKQEYSAKNEEEITNNALAKFVADKKFENFYLKFDGKNAYTYDPFADREATWVFYKTSENAGFISFYAELDVNEGNPDPVICPALSFNADKGTMSIVLNDYGAFMITLELTR